MGVFIDSSIWFAAASSRDRNHDLAVTVLSTIDAPVTTDHVIVETWLLLNSRYRFEIAERFWRQARRGAVHIETIVAADIERAWSIGQDFTDQTFSIVDRTSFAVMERLGLTKAASLDSDFAIYRYGRSRDKAFEIVGRASARGRRG